MGLSDWLRARSRPTEESHEYDGVLSYADEWHALVLGLGVGITGNLALVSAVVSYALGRGSGSLDTSDPHVRDVAEEPAYAIGGMVVGWLVGGHSFAVVLDVVGAASGYVAIAL